MTPPMAGWRCAYRRRPELIASVRASSNRAARPAGRLRVVAGGVRRTATPRYEQAQEQEGMYRRKAHRFAQSCRAEASWRERDPGAHAVEVDAGDGRRGLGDRGDRGRGRAG